MPPPDASKEGLPDMCEPQLVELSNGTVRLEMRHCASKPGWPHNSRGFALSDDGGVSFGAIIPSGMNDGGSQGESRHTARPSHHTWVLTVTVGRRLPGLDHASGQDALPVEHQQPFLAG